VATQVVASRVILDGAPPEEVAAELGVSRRTVAMKLTRFLAIARQHVAVALAAATLAGCSPGFDGPDAPATGAFQGAAVQAALVAPASEAPAGALAAAGAAAVDAPAPRGDTRMPDGAVDPFNRSPTTPALQADGTQARPQLANVSPASGAPAGGGEVLITGSGFANVQVMFGGAVARVLNQSSNAVTVVAPEGAAGPCPVVVTNRDGAYVVGGSAYTYQ
jgi:hypothetical protein